MPDQPHEKSTRCESCAALAESIVTAIEGRFRDWLMSSEHAEAKQLVAEILDRELNGRTVKAEDYDRLREAATWLRRSCKDRLPRGHYDKVSEECREIDAILSHRAWFCNSTPVNI